MTMCALQPQAEKNLADIGIFFPFADGKAVEIGVELRRRALRKQNFIVV